MAEREKVMKGLECCSTFDSYGFPLCEECPYADDDGTCHELDQLHRDVFSLLKAQEPVAPYMDYDGQDVWRCGSCGATLFHLSHTQADENEQNCVKFCRYCGKAVKWDG